MTATVYIPPTPTIGETQERARVRHERRHARRPPLRRRLDNLAGWAAHAFSELGYSIEHPTYQFNTWEIRRFYKFVEAARRLDDALDRHLWKAHARAVVEAWQGKGDPPECARVDDCENKVLPGHSLCWNCELIYGRPIDETLELLSRARWADTGEPVVVFRLVMEERSAPPPVRIAGLLEEHRAE